MDRPVKTELAPACTTARAVVHACGCDTEYLRAGRGPAVVLVTADIDSDEVVRTVKLLATGFRVIAAAPVVGSMGELHVWLRGFLEGLGLSDPHVILHASVAPRFLTLSVTPPE